MHADSVEFVLLTCNSAALVKSAEQFPVVDNEKWLQIPCPPIGEALQL